MGRYMRWCRWGCSWCLWLAACGGRVGGTPEDDVHSNTGATASVANSSGGTVSSSGAGVAETVGGSVSTLGGRGIDVSVPQFLPEEPCGNAQLDNDEQCDDANRISGDGCSATCQLEQGRCPPSDCVVHEVCGDGKLGPNEQC